MERSPSLAAELAPPPPLLSILVAHEATHAVQSTLDCAWDGDDYTLGALLFAEGLATYVSALAFPGLPWDHYLWFDSSHEAWLRQCGDAWPAASAALADALETCGGDAEHRFFSGRADEGDAVPVRFGYYAGCCVAQELVQHRRVRELVHCDMAAAHGLVTSSLESARPLMTSLATAGVGHR